MPVILVIAWVVIIGLFAYSFWADNDETANTNTDNPGSESSLEQADANVLANRAAMTADELEQGRVRDLQRLNHMKTLRSALSAYKQDKGNYPETLDNLVPDYIDAVPTNPGPGGQDYNYTGIGASPYQYFEVAYVLEVGAENIAAGLHVMSPDALAMW